MLTKEDLKMIVILTYLTDTMLDNLLPFIANHRFNKDDIVFKQNDPADRFYMVRSGKVVLEQEITPDLTISMSAIMPGYSFGWSAMLEEDTYTSDAVCVEPSVVFSFQRQRIESLLTKDPEMGYRLYQRLLVIIKKRYDIRTEQLRQTVLNHPDMGVLSNITTGENRRND